MRHCHFSRYHSFNLISRFDSSDNRNHEIQLAFIDNAIARTRLSKLIESAIEENVVVSADRLSEQLGVFCVDESVVLSVFFYDFEAGRRRGFMQRNCLFVGGMLDFLIWFVRWPSFRNGS